MALSNAEKQRRFREKRKAEAQRGRDSEAAENTEIAGWLCDAIGALDRTMPESREQFQAVIGQAARAFRDRRFQLMQSGELANISVEEQRAIERILTIIDTCIWLRNQ